MSYDTFTPAVDPSISSSAGEETRVLQANFGDGYSQRSADGLNNIQGKFQISIEGLQRSDLDTILTFMRGKNGVTPFLYTFPGESSSRKFICQKWNWTAPGGVVWNFSAEFQEVFDL